MILILGKTKHPVASIRGNCKYAVGLNKSKKTPLKKIEFNTRASCQYCVRGAASSVIGVPAFATARRFTVAVQLHPQLPIEGCCWGISGCTARVSWPNNAALCERQITDAPRSPSCRVRLYIFPVIAFLLADAHLCPRFENHPADKGSYYIIGSGSRRNFDILNSLDIAGRKTTTLGDEHCNTRQDGG